MLLALVLCQLLVLVTPNPFHKYPFVFLLDVGNEELEKANSEQIRISVPGGSVALRYPAIGDGKPIAHIRVSGIDFGTDLKANIVDGGPGYKYVVLVFMGNPGVAYDAVVTVQTVNDQTFNIQNIGSVANSVVDPDQAEENLNNSAEDLSDDTVVNDRQNQNYVQSSNAELMQSSSNVYNYAESEVIEQKDDNEDDDGDDDDGETGDDEQDNEELDSNDNVSPDLSKQEDIQEQYSKYTAQEDSDIQVKGIDTMDQDNDDDDDDEIGPNAEQYSQIDYAEENEPISIVGAQFDTKYDGPKPHLIAGEVYYQYDGQKNKRPDYQQEPLDYENLDEEQPVFNDGEDHDNVDKYKDSNNNNYIDSDDSFAVAY